MSDEFLPGVLEDTRTEEEKSKDYIYNGADFSFAAVPTWKEKKQTEWRKFNIRSQDGSGSCVYQALAKILEVNNFIDPDEKVAVMLSSRDGYSVRSNVGQYPGSSPIEALKYGCKHGLTIEQLMPSQNLGEKMMEVSSDRTPTSEHIATLYKGKNYFTLNKSDINEITFVIEQQYGVMLCFKASMKEWNQNVVKPIAGTTEDQMLVRHAVAGVDYTLKDTEEHIIIEDSWGSNYGINGQRLIHKSMFTSGRCTFAGYITDLNNLAELNDQLVKPTYTFNTDLCLGDSGEEVGMLQRCLATLKDNEGYLFPLNQNVTKYYGPITLAAVKRFQVKYNITPVTGYCGPKTRSQLNSIFGG